METSSGEGVNLQSQVQSWWFVRSVAGRTVWDSGSGLDLTVEGLSLGLQAPELPLDEVSQGLPHFHLTGNLK